MKKSTPERIEPNNRQCGILLNGGFGRNAFYWDVLFCLMVMNKRQHI